MSGGRSIDEVSARTGIRRELIRELFREDQRRGVVQRLPDGTFALTPQASRRFAAALRDITPIDREE